MYMTLYDTVVQFVDTSFKGKQKRHFERTVFWLEKFLPDITETERIAGYAHDIERAIKGEKERNYLDKDILERHSEDGAKIMAEFLKKQGVDEKVTTMVKHLISWHEMGGDLKQNALMDADSVSFLRLMRKCLLQKERKLKDMKK